MIQDLSAQGADVSKTANLLGAAVSVRDVYDLAMNAKFNEYDAFDAAGEGYFILQDADGNDVYAYREHVDTLAEILDVEAKVNMLRTVIQSAGLSPVDGMDVTLDVPVGNVEEIADFSDGSGNSLTLNADGTQRIEIQQTTELLDVQLDFAKLSSALMISLIDLAKPALAVTSPQYIPMLEAAKGMILYQAELQATAAEGVTAEMTLQPAALVTEMANSLFDAVNLFGGALDGLVPGESVYTPIAQIDQQDTLDSLDAALTTAENGVSAAFDALEPMIDVPLGVLQTVNDAVSGALSGLVNLSANGYNLVSQPIIDQINWGLGILDQAANFGVTVWLPFGKSYSYKPLAGVLNPAISGLHAVRSALEGGIDAIQSLNGLIADLNETVNTLLTTDFSGLFDPAMEAFHDGAMALAEGAEFVVSLGVTPFQAAVEASMELTQIMSFDPNAISATYSFDNYSVETGMGTAVGFFAPEDAAGQTLVGQAAYDFSGTADYEYRLGVNLLPIVSLFDMTLKGAFQVGTTDPLADEFEFDFALVGNGSFTPGDASSYTDEALLEIPFEQMQDAVLNAIGGALADHDLPLSGDVVDGEITLFRVEDVEITEAMFQQMLHEFDVNII
ncbi:hypothetical protein SAMN04488093_101694 [Tropicibacter naphthalenivorans]|uniref:Uncharacterized protein n=2 Tax=Tropicibacter naphthalenivorans TaxID=441103 RepID=A0A0N7LYI8_9RHOB|nr:hypothetical protein TRN7648_00184 [Tropicibacter naphthalenivorans]SMC47611.1 hypothetical protein SAMN04488093_101694 [Tropicibacter naphthalenivorans]